MYLNPQLGGYCNVLTVQQATTVHQTWGSTLPSDLPMPPKDFTPDGYIVLNRDRIDVTGINMAIRQSLQVAGVPEQRSGRYLPTILQTLTPIASNAFRADVSLSRYLTTGDYVKIVSSNVMRAPDVMLTEVTGLDGGTMTVSDAIRSSNSAFVLVGTEIVDPKRLAYVDAARQFASGCNNVYPPDNIRTFDFYLYKTLYYEAQSMTPSAAYLDYVSRRTAGDFRVRTGGDVLSALAIETGRWTQNGLTVSTKLVLSPGTQLIWNGTHLSNVTSDVGEPPSETNRTLQMSMILTEAGVKSYMETRLQSIQDLAVSGTVSASNIAASGSMSIGAATLQSYSNSLALSGVSDVQCNGSITAKSFKALSDRRFKMDIMTDTKKQQHDDLQKLLRVKVSRYRFVDEDKCKRKGVIAQELVKHFPDAVEDTLRPVHIGVHTVTSTTTPCQLQLQRIKRLTKLNDGTTTFMLGGPVPSAITDIQVMQRVKVVDYEYLMMAMLNAIKLIPRNCNWVVWTDRAPGSTRDLDAVEELLLTGRELPRGVMGGVSSI
ncbi:hypothetical protein TSOC_000530 [Tetrabaena socialis]|uniref:Peptidase S74 domain-containing protein n=1 Tax=Tetrabaena socialis TaxID=47790 RepID=A0A2J8AJ88_9CHLO|nr:hypothetical protein TSOC_000530 [Tetrabaena socialis]|eukprot:PNH12574.1 hypothetical protein TSOC_000530 [Tetrabaena socialis]